MPGIRGYVLAAVALLTWASSAQTQSPCGSWNPVSVTGAVGNELASFSASSATDILTVW